MNTRRAGPAFGMYGRAIAYGLCTALLVSGARAQGVTRSSDARPSARRSPAARVVSERGSSNGRRTAALVIGGLGAAGIAVSAVTAMLALEKKGVAEDHCSDTLRVCDAAGVRANDDGRTLGRISVIGLLVGALGFGSAIVLWPSPERRSPRVAFQTAVTRTTAEAVLVGRW